MTKPLALALLAITALGSPATAQTSDKPAGLTGIASIYSHRGKTASGEAGNPKDLTAAHRSLPFGTMVQVTNAKNGRTVMVRINDRGPFARKRVIDISPVAARQLGFSGLTAVKLDVVTP
jgi:rare lipoprotein A